MKLRRVISLTVFLAFIVLALSGLALFVSPQGRVANWAVWRLIGLTKEQYGAVHTTFMVLFLVVGVWHIVLNWRPILGYLKNRSKQVRLFTPESSLALAITGIFLAGPLLGIPPFRQFLDAGEELKAYWETTQGAPPWGHAEENSLQRFCRGMVDYERLEHEREVTIDCQEALTALRTAGMQVEGLQQSLTDMARINGTSPQALSEIVMSVARTATPEEMAAEAMGSGAPGDAVAPEPAFRKPYSGLGRMTIRGYAEEYGYTLDSLLVLLVAEGAEGDPDHTFREEAAILGLDPEGLLERLNARAGSGEGGASGGEGRLGR